MFRTGDFTEYFGGSLGPDVGLGMAVVVVEIAHDGLLQFVDAFEDAAADALSGDLGKEPLDHVEPRAGRGREVQVKARVPLEPALYRGGLVSGIVVDDEMQVEMRQRPLVDEFEEAEELAMPVAGWVKSFYFPVQWLQNHTPLGSPLLEYLSWWARTLMQPS